MRVVFYLLFYLVGAMFLSGCITTPMKHVPICSDKGLEVVQANLEGVRGQFVELGDTVLVTMPTYYLFQGHSNNMTPANAILINQVAERLNCYPTQSIGVITYEGRLKCADANVSLGRQRSHFVADVLRSYNVGRLIYEKSEPVREYDPSCFENRIEIVTKKMR